MDNELINKTQIYKETLNAKEWKATHPNAKGNIRDSATITQLTVLANLENLNAQYIKDGISQKERLLKLNSIAIEQLNIFKNNNNLLNLERNKNTKLLNK